MNLQSKLSLCDFYLRLGFPPETCGWLLENPLPPEEEQRLVRLFHQNRPALFDELERQEKGKTSFLQLYCKIAYFLYQSNDPAQGIPDEVLLDGYSDLALWNRLSLRYFGVPGIVPYMHRFLDRILDGRIWRLGRLEFEPKATTEDYALPECFLPKGSIILNVHVPEGASLLPEECEKSYRGAASFFRGIPPLFFCDSWLLSPVLQDILPKESNILSFQRRYRLVGSDPSNRLMEERIFEDILDDPALYEENTCLQRGAKKRLLEGQSLGSGFGFLTEYMNF